ncbi:MAG: tetratricopeptide repeat protein, partial [Methanoregula sp.]|nr:tetratricopeptide repeat protein [Methanoregula sp.]
MRSQYRILLIAAILMCTLFVLPVSAISADAVNWYTQGNTLVTSRNYTDAVVAFDHAISLEPAYVEAWNGKADALNRAHNYTEALTASDKVIALDPN